MTDGQLFVFTCRACLERKVDKLVHCLKNPENSKIFTEVTNLPVSPDDIYLTLCDWCYTQCRNFRTFRNMCKNNSKHLEQEQSSGKPKQTSYSTQTTVAKKPPPSTTSVAVSTTPRNPSECPICFQATVSQKAQLSPKCRKCPEIVGLIKHLLEHTCDSCRGSIKFTCSSTNRGKCPLAPKDRPESSETLVSYTCRFCEQTFSSRKDFRQHTTLLIENLFWSLPGDKVCPVCLKTFEQGDLLRHLESHAQVWYWCKDCDQNFDNRNLLKEHHERCHEVIELDDSQNILVDESQSVPMDDSPSIPVDESQRVFVDAILNCHLCDRDFLNYSEYSQHFKEQHKRTTSNIPARVEYDDTDDLQEAMELCYSPVESEEVQNLEGCKKSSKEVNKSALLLRLNYKLAGIKNSAYKCIECEVKISTIQEAVRHRSKHKDPTVVSIYRTFPCKDCGQMLKSQEAKESHQRNVCPGK